MAIIFTKFTNEVKTDLQFFKFAYQFWLEENNPEAYANVTLGLMNLSKDFSASGFTIYFPFEVYDIQSISNTLLDQNSLLNSARGGYEYPRDGSNFMAEFDGVPNVRIDLLHDIELHSHLSKRMHLSQLNILFTNDITPGEKIGLRFVFKTKGVITRLDDGIIYFLCKIFDPQFSHKFVHGNNLEGREIKVQCNYDWDKRSGGFDPILFYPLDYEIKEVTQQYDSIVDRSDLNYNYLGEKIKERYKKATWRARQILNCTKDNQIIGYENNIQWFCTIQNSKVLNKMVKDLRRKLEEQSKKTHIFSILSVVFAVLSIILGILAIFL